MNKKARDATKIYHNKLYTSKKLFQKGSSWLEKPNEEIIEIAKNNFYGKRNVRVLDLGAGVGRNAIPLAIIIGKLGGTITCVDYLDLAIDKLNKYAKEYNVNKYIKGIVSPIEAFIIEPKTYDYIIAHSVLTHTESKNKMFQIVKNMVEGTKNNGINYINEITNPREFDAETGEKLDPDAEIDISFEEFKIFLEHAYKGWTIQSIKKNPYEERFKKNGKEVVWTTDYLSFIAKAGTIQ